jgi:hypothetical protein
MISLLSGRVLPLSDVFGVCQRHFTRRELLELVELIGGAYT